MTAASQPSGQTLDSPAFRAGAHDHEVCIEQALMRAESRCAACGLRLTAIRRRVLELIWANHRPTKAYDLIEMLGRERRRVAPPTVYRALDFLLEAGLVHRIESLNAFIGCDGQHGERPPKFLICRACERVAEIHAPRVDDMIAREAERLGFAIDTEIVEVGGLCQPCTRRRR